MYVYMRRGIALSLAQGAHQGGMNDEMRGKESADQLELELKGNCRLWGRQQKAGGGERDSGIRVGSFAC